MCRIKLRIDFSKIYLKKQRINIQKGHIVNLDRNQTLRYKISHLLHLWNSFGDQRMRFNSKLDKVFMSIYFV